MTARAMSQSALTSVAVMGTGLLTGIVAARILGPEDRGYLGIIVFWPTLIASLLRLPLADAFIVQYNRPGEYTQALLALTTRYACIMPIVVAPVFAGALWLCVRHLPTPILLLTLAFGVVQLFATYSAEVFTGYLKALQRFAAQNWLKLSIPISYLCLILLFLPFGAGLPAFVLAHALSLILGSVLGLLMLDSARPATSSCSEPAQWRQSVISLYGVGLLSIVASSIDRILFFPLSDPHRIGQYLIAMTICTPAMGIIVTALGTIVFPSLAAKSEVARVASAVRVLRLALVSGLMVGLGVAVVSPFIVPLVFGPDYVSAGWLASQLAVASMFLPARISFIQICMANNRFSVVQQSLIIMCLVAAVTYFALLQIDFVEWPIAIALGAAQFSSVAFFSVHFHRLHPSTRARDWLVPNPETVVELFQIAFSGLKLKANRRP